ncbi:GGDEF-domain containing protein [Novosphingobium endophyticum]|uniref:GGDEF-domain containing protein n=2 Tax=Novosphingobium endophyticum TaxID=1955250 RepID=A0A916TU74_9SPHN|nr:GGDEF-domain containing protein [Novosphingobium endophyticum]
MPYETLMMKQDGQPGQHPLPVAQYLRLRSQIPPLYGLLAINSVILAYTHRALAPQLLTLTIPAVLVGASLLRMLMWFRPVVARDFEPALAEARLRRTVYVAAAMAAGFVTWALLLANYGGPYEQNHFAIYVVITLLGCVFCLNYLPSAAMLICVAVLAVFFAYCVARGSEVLLAIAVNVALVAAVILKVLRTSYASFVHLESTQRELTLERRQAQNLGEENARLAQTDALTGLPNRRYFFSALESLLECAERNDRFCVGLIDLDRFKPVNDTHGHVQGDRLLQLIGERMMMQCPANVIVARLGGDEFGLIVMGGLEQAETVTQTLFGAIRQPARLGDVIVSVGCSAGLAVYPDAATSANSLFDRADFALYHAKNNKRGQCVRFSAELEDLIRSEQALDSALQAADLKNELSIVVQPIVHTETMTPLGVECLARWHSPTIGSAAPELLISAAERVGRARQVTLTLFDKALVALDVMPEEMRISFNLSGNDVGDPETIDALLERIAASGHSPTRLLFEITESSLISEIDNARTALERLRAQGVRIALDDFGTGYSSLSSLHQLPLDMIKIDRSFAARLDEANGRRLISAIRNLSRALSLDCVIEGIETETQLVSARMAGFLLAQGYFIARPMPLEQFERQLRGPEVTNWKVA